MKIIGSIISTLFSTLLLAVVVASVLFLVGLLFSTGWTWVGLFRFIFWAWLAIEILLSLYKIGNSGSDF